MDLQQLFQRAVGLHQSGRLAEAEPLYLELAQADPNNFAVQRLLASLRARLGRPAEALANFDHALALSPGHPEMLASRGVTLCALGHFAQALEDFGAALATTPQDFGTWNNRALALREMGRFAEALTSCEKALAIRSGFELAHNSRGLALLDLGRAREASQAFETALMIRPAYVEALNNHGMALFALRRFDEAVMDYDRALALAPGYADAWTHRGLALREMNRFDDALASFDRALTILPDSVTALHARANLRGTRLKDLAPAIADMERAVLLAPGFDYARGELLHMKMLAGDWRDFDAEVAQINDGVRAGQRVIQPFAYQAIAQSPSDLLACTKTYAGHLYPAVAAPAPPLRRHDRIRLAYMSGELREHAVSYLMAGLFERHDRTRFELIALDNGHDDGGPTRERLNRAFERILPIAQLPDSAVAELIRAEEIDILVNLNGIFGGMRMGVFAARPAPIQVSYLGTPGTLGSPCIDYLIADDCVIPKSEQAFYAEQIAILPDTYWVNDDRRPIAPQTPKRAATGLPADAFVFCDFNNSYKITPAMFGGWMRILQQVDGSVLWLLESNRLFADNLRRAAEAQGVDAARLVFAPMLPSQEHLARLKLADLCLDSLPYNAHTTASDALWAGVPILTCRGSTFPGRVAASLLTAIGLPELITKSMDDYEAMAVALAHDPARLKDIRAKLEQNRTTTPLFDTARFTRSMEAAYQRMWDIWQAGEAPRSFRA